MDGETIVLKQSELSRREPTPQEQAEIDRRINEGVDLWDPEEKQANADENDGDKKEEKENANNPADDKEQEEGKDESSEDAKEKRDGKKKEKIEEDGEEANSEETDESSSEEGDDEKGDDDGEKAEHRKKVVSEYVEKHGVSMEEAESLYDSERKIVDKFGGDSHKIASAYRNMQAAYTESQNKVKALESERSERVSEPIVNGDTVIIGTQKFSSDKIVEAFREKEPDLTDGMDDAKVLRVALKEFSVEVRKAQEQIEKELVDKASARRKDLIAKLSPSDRRFIGDISPLLDKLPNQRVLEEDFSLNDLLFWAKGKNLSRIERDAEERGYKRGLEQRKILGTKQTPEGSGKKGSSGDSTGLTANEKAEAEKMFENDDIPKEKKYELYKEIKEHSEALSKKRSEKEKE